MGGHHISFSTKFSFGQIFLLKKIFPQPKVRGGRSNAPILLATPLQQCHWNTGSMFPVSYNRQFLQFLVSVIFCVVCFIKVKLFVLLLCVCAILPAKAVLEMTYTVSGGTYKLTRSENLTELSYLTFTVSQEIWSQSLYGLEQL